MADLSAHLEALLEVASRTEPGPERDRAVQAVLDDAAAEDHAEDAAGHEHKGKGPGGGQFTKKGGGGEGGGKEKKAPTAPKKPPAEVEKPAAQEYNPTPADLAEQPTPRVATPEEHRAAIARAQAKFENVPQPSPEDVARAKAGMAEMGANAYRKKLVGNVYGRRARRNKLLAEFGDGQSCPCIYCGTHLGHGTLEQDKILTTAQGGKYQVANLVPACGDCNKERGDMPFDEALAKVVKRA